MPIQIKDVGVKSLLQNWKRQRAIKHTKHKEKFTEVAEVTEINRRLNLTTMALPKQVELSQTSRKSIVRTRAQIQWQESKQQPLEVVNVDKIPSLDTTPINPTHIVEETQ
jgi:hypothetical protein